MRPLESENEQITVRGIVAPSEWNARDEVTAVTIYAHDEKEYVVNARSMVKKLLKHADEEVEVQGYLTEDEYGDEVLLVSDFTVLTETTEEDLEFEDEEFAKEAEGGSDDEDSEDEEDEWWDNSQDDEDLVWADDDEDDSWKRFRDR